MKKLYVILSIVITVLLVLPLILFGVRLALARLAVEREWRSGPTQAFTLEGTAKLEIIPLYEEAGSGAEFISGHGVSYLIRTDTFTILMDVGDNPEQMPVPPFYQNLQTLGIASDAIDAILISHPHPDHVGGVSAWREHVISLGITALASADIPVYLPFESNYTGSELSKLPTLVSPDMATIGVISYPEVFPLSVFQPKGVEQALVVNVAGEGLVLITGCGHPGLERLVLRTESLYDLPVVGVVGGLHYEGVEETELHASIEFLHSRSPKLVALSSHDSSAEALEAFRSAFPKIYRDLIVGQTIQFP